MAGGSPSRPDTLKQTDQPPISAQTPCRRGGPYVFEDRNARISIMAGGSPSRPDTLKQTDQPPISAQTPCRRGGPYVYGMARPSFRRHRVAGGSGGGMGMDIAVLGVDLGKNVCSVVGLDTSGAVVMRRKVRRETLIALAEKLPACVVGMEACCG